MSRLDELIALWEGEARTVELAAGETGRSATLRRCAQQLREAITRHAPEARRDDEQAALWGEQPARVCTRCGRKLLHPEWLNGAPFGRVCHRKEALGE